VRRSPDATALAFQDTAASFAEVDERANRLAHLLIASGVGPERVVALLLPRSAELVVTMLAVFKAGGVYLPIDPDLPAERVRFLLRDAGAVLTVSTMDSPNACDGATASLVLDAPETIAALDRSPTTDPTDADRISPLRPD